MRRRHLAGLLAGGIALVPVVWFAYAWITYPNDHTVEGAYLRIVAAVNRGRAEDVFPYLETAAQHASFTIRDYRSKARDRILAAYPEPERSRLAASYEPAAKAADGAEVFALFAAEQGWLVRMRRDMSRIDKLEIQGERATLQTIRGTRYSFRRGANGIWGLTLFSASLTQEALKAARDFGMVDRAARDYERARGRRQK